MTLPCGLSFFTAWWLGSNGEQRQRDRKAKRQRQREKGVGGERGKSCNAFCELAFRNHPYLPPHSIHMKWVIKASPFSREGRLDVTSYWESIKELEDRFLNYFRCITSEKITEREPKRIFIVLLKVRKKLNSKRLGNTK